MDAVRIDRRCAAPMTPVVPVREWNDRGKVVPQVLPDEAVAQDSIAEDGLHAPRSVPGRLRMDIQTSPVPTNRERRRVIGCSRGSCRRCGSVRVRRGQPPSSSSPPSTSLTLGSFLISVREIFHARCTTQESERSSLAASSLIS